MAAGYGRELREFAGLVWPRLGLYQHDLDWGKPQLEQSLSQLTSTDSKAIANTTLRKFMSTLSGSELSKLRSERGLGRWVLSFDELRRRHRDDPPFPNYGVQYCSECLKSDEAPYFRICWRLRLFAICPIHELVLKDCCTGCSRPIHHFPGGLAGLRTPTSAEPASPLRCCVCGASLKDAKGSNRPSERLLSSQEFHRRLLYDEQRRIPRQTEYFDTLRKLLGMIAAPSRLPMQRMISKEASCLVPDVLVAPWEAASAINRARTLEMAAWLFEDWPARLIWAMQACEPGDQRAMKDIVMQFTSADLRPSISIPHSSAA